MSGATFILGINLFVAGLLAAAFAAIAVYDTRRVSARWLSLAYVAGMANFLTEFAIRVVGTSVAAVVFSFALILGAMVVFNIGVARKYGVAPPLRTMAAIFAASVAACYLIQDMPRDSFTRMLIYQTPFAFMQAVAAWVVWKAGTRDVFDKGLMALLAVSSVQFLSKPFLSAAFGGTGASAQDYLSTTYALFSQSMGTVFAMAIALMMLVILVRGILAEATQKSETDTLSSLLNRGGFERQAELAVRGAERSGVPIAVAICDLDHFKAINDNYGHAAGDRVIQAFGAFLSETTSSHHIVGRIGGEEFAVLLPGSNLVAARLFAEGARAAFAGLPIDGVPADSRVTASFGVAELTPDETIAGLMQRADEALYEAKKAGRDCVRVSFTLPGPSRNIGHG